MMPMSSVRPQWRNSKPLAASRCHSFQEYRKTQVEQRLRLEIDRHSEGGIHVVHKIS